MGRWVHKSSGLLSPMDKERGGGGRQSDLVEVYFIFILLCKETRNINNNKNTATKINKNLVFLSFYLLNKVDKKTG